MASLLLFLSSPAPVNATVSPLIRSVCKDVLHYKIRNYCVCMKALWPDARIKSASNLKDVGIATLELAKEKANVSLASFNNILSNNDNRDFALCASMYSFVVKRRITRLLNYILEIIQNYHSICMSVVTPKFGSRSDGIQIPNTTHETMVYVDVAVTITSGPSGIFQHAE
ncbi:hypothetical protein DVH24_009308 [Malus domestica]|uniref:Pectinesterase inhibitor domain-containing protein n=1 Tax=Malus domestica TaxID=3750 RepID=A0A498ITN6_MALDO|nr:hypothetical protein DVH24_009308 [Malus domestica]